MIVALNKFIIIMTPYGVKKMIAVSIDTPHFVLTSERTESYSMMKMIATIYMIVYSQMSA